MDVLRCRGRHVMHDHWFSSLLYGEAFLDDDKVAYFDGRALTLCAFPLAGRDLPDRTEVARWAVGWVERTGAEALLLIAPNCPDLRHLRASRMERFHTWRARLIGREMIAPVIDPAVRGSGARRARRALQAPYEVNIGVGGGMDAARLRLIERFQRDIGMTPYLAGLTAAWPAVLTRKHVSFIEARDASGVRGFIAMHRPFASVAVAIGMARDERASGVGDFLYAQMLVQAGAWGCAAVNLGPSVTPGQFRYKLKWAQPSELPAHASTEWRRGNLTRRHYNLWVPRTMQKSS